MKLNAPEYYKKFKCIADKCSHSCCIGWEIDIDEKTAQKYADLKENYGKEIIKSIDFDGVPHFRLGKGERCPHLNEKGLCKIILNIGEGYLCHICREHPRFYNDTAYGTEVGLGMCCEEACRLILSCDDYSKITTIDEADEDMKNISLGEDDKDIFSAPFDKALNVDENMKNISLGEDDKDIFSAPFDKALNVDEDIKNISLGEDAKSVFLCEKEEPFDALLLRKSIFSILSDDKSTYCNKLERIYLKYRISPNVLPDEEWRNVISSLEYLDNMHKSIFLNYSSKVEDMGEANKYLERALGYFIFRHCTSAYDECDFYCSLGFSLFCERLFASIIRCFPGDFEKISEIARVISEEIEYSEENTEKIKDVFLKL